MQAAVITSAGTDPHLAEFPDPVAEADEILVHLQGAGLHRVVRSLASGAHYGSTGIYPLVPGIDGVGQDDEGRSYYVARPRAPWGTMATEIASRLHVALPEGSDPVQVAGLVNPGLSSWMPITEHIAARGGLDRVVVLGATGSAGRLAIQNARALGAGSVVAVGRNPERLQDAAGDLAVPVLAQDGDDALAAALEGGGTTLVLDYLWGPSAEQLWRALAVRGLDGGPGSVEHIQIGTLAGPTAALPGTLLRSRDVMVRGTGAGSSTTRDQVAQLPRFLDLLLHGVVDAPIRRFALSDVASAWAYTGPERAVLVPDASI